jgi:hypothetical protein
VKALCLSVALIVGAVLAQSQALAAVAPGPQPPHRIHGIIIHRCHWRGRIVPCRHHPGFPGIIVHHPPGVHGVPVHPVGGVGQGNPGLVNGIPVQQQPQQ